MNWTFIILFSFAALFVLVFIILRKQNDEGDAEEKLNDDYDKPYTKRDNEADEAFEKTPNIS